MAASGGERLLLVLEGGGLHPKVGGMAHHPQEGKGTGGGEQALEGLEDESRHGATHPRPHQKQHRNAHTDELGREKGGSYGVFAWQEKNPKPS